MHLYTVPRSLYDISADVEDEKNVDVNCRLIYSGVKTLNVMNQACINFTDSRESGEELNRGT